MSTYMDNDLVGLVAVTATAASAGTAGGDWGRGLANSRQQAGLQVRHVVKAAGPLLHLGLLYTLARFVVQICVFQGKGLIASWKGVAHQREGGHQQKT